jgi:hypothetical protein
MDVILSLSLWSVTYDLYYHYLDMNFQEDQFSNEK